MDTLMLVAIRPIVPYCECWVFICLSHPLDKVTRINTECVHMQVLRGQGYACRVRPYPDGGRADGGRAGRRTLALAPLPSETKTRSSSHLTILCCVRIIIWNCLMAIMWVFTRLNEWNKINSLWESLRILQELFIKMIHLYIKCQVKTIEARMLQGSTTPPRPSKNMFRSALADQGELSTPVLGTCKIDLLI